MLIVGFGHKKQRGKDTCADHLVSKYNFKKVSLADNLREAASKIFHIPIEVFLDPVLKEVVDKRWGLTPRQILQKMGTDAMRLVFGPDIWSKSLYIGNAQSKAISIADVRFPDEADEIKKRNGIVIRVDRDLELPSDNHKSESALDNYNEWDYIVDNNSSFEDLYKKLDNIMSGLTNER